MALTERSRAALFRGLSDVLDDEEAVSELLSYFPARDVDELATRDFVDARITKVEARFDSLEARMDARFDSLEARMGSRFAGVDARFGSVDAHFDSVDAHFDSVDPRFDSVDARFASLEATMAAEFAKQRELNATALHAEIRSLTRWVVGSLVAIGGLLVTLRVIG